MSFGIPVIYDNGAQRLMNIGDVFARGQKLPVTNATAANLAITPQMMLQEYILRNPAGVSNENLDTAANMIQAWGNGIAVQAGLTFVLRWIVTTVQTLTVLATANTGVNVTRPSIVGATFKEYLITVVNGSLAQTFAATTTNASAVVGGLTPAQCALLTPGMIVTNAVANLQGTTIIAVNIAAGTVTMSGNANATNGAPGVAIAFSPVVNVDGLAP